MIKRGDKGSTVEAFQAILKKLGMYSGKVDGLFGANTERAVKSFQQSRGLLVDGVIGPQTKTALRKTINFNITNDIPIREDRKSLPQITKPPTHDNISRCSKQSWDRYLRFRNCLLGENSSDFHVTYGPGRGLFVDNKWLVTYGPGKLGRTSWPVKGGKTSPSLHCSSLTNLFLGYMLNYNEKWTHQGNMPSQTKMCLQDSSMHTHTGRIKYRGYGQNCMRLASDGDTAARWKIRGKFMHLRLDAQEVWDRRKELATFNMWSQTTRKGQSKLKWDHHVGLFIYDHTEDVMYRLAADGYRDSRKKYSATPVRFTEIDENWCKEDAKKKFYQIMRVVPDDDQGNFGIAKRSFPIDLEIVDE